MSFQDGLNAPNREAFLSKLQETSSEILKLSFIPSKEQSEIQNYIASRKPQLNQTLFKMNKREEDAKAMLELSRNIKDNLYGIHSCLKHLSHEQFHQSK
jgi:flagellar motor switch protein FliG